MELQTYIIAAASLIGLVNGVKLLLDKNHRGFAFFAVAVVAGTVFGYLRWFDLPSAEIGFALGLASSGTYEAAQRIGGN